MVKIESLKDAVVALSAYIPLAKAIAGKNITRERTFALLKEIGNPQDHLTIIHSAGTSGKTSTSYYIAALLHKSQRKVGLTVSPHIRQITERVQIDGAPLREEVFCKYLREFLSLSKNQQPTYFELLIAFAYWVFAKEHVDYAVVETGMGGLHDSTNVAQRADKVCVITDIGFDHTHVLGNTLSLIAAQKAGIIHRDNHVFMYEQDPAVMHVIRERCVKQHATLHIVEDTHQHTSPTFLALPLFQRRNWHLAYAVHEYLQQRDGLRALAQHDYEETMHTHIPGRMEVTQSVSGKELIFDGAHNGQKMHAFVTSFMHTYPQEKASVLVGIKDGKEYTDIIDELLPIAHHIIITSFSLQQDFPHRSTDPHLIAKYCKSKNFNSIEIIPEQTAALKRLYELDEKILVVTGSFYLVSQIQAEIHNTQT